MIGPFFFFQSRAFQLPGSIRDGGPLSTQHLGQKILRNQESIIVATVTHHEEPARQPLRKAVGAVAGDRYHDLFEKGLDIIVHEGSKGRHRFQGPRIRRARR